MRTRSDQPGAKHRFSARSAPRNANSIQPQSQRLGRSRLVRWTGNDGKNLEMGRAEDAFTHWLTTGEPAGLRSASQREAPITELAARTLFRERARAMAVLHARTTLDFTFDSVPALSVILILHNQFELTMMALGSLRANYPGGIEVILIDSGS